MTDPKKPQADDPKDDDKVEGLPWDHPDQDPDVHPDLDDLRKSEE
jgi:hypothetical protein